MTLQRSTMDLASRSNRQTTSTSPSRTQSRATASSSRPEAVVPLRCSAKIFSHPAAASWSTCRANTRPVVLTSGRAVLVAGCLIAACSALAGVRPGPWMIAAPPDRLLESALTVHETTCAAGSLGTSNRRWRSQHRQHQSNKGRAHIEFRHRTSPTAASRRVPRTLRNDSNRWHR
jgi:hypothetical protein